MCENATVWFLRGVLFLPARFFSVQKWCEHTLNQKLKQMDTFNGKITLSIIQMNVRLPRFFPLFKCSLECYGISLLLFESNSFFLTLCVTHTNLDSPFILSINLISFYWYLRLLSNSQKHCLMDFLPIISCVFKASEQMNSNSAELNHFWNINGVVRCVGLTLEMCS